MRTQYAKGVARLLSSLLSALPYLGDPDELISYAPFTSWQLNGLWLPVAFEFNYKCLALIIVTWRNREQMIPQALSLQYLHLSSSAHIKVSCRVLKKNVSPFSVKFLSSKTCETICLYLKEKPVSNHERSPILFRTTPPRGIRCVGKYLLISTLFNIWKQMVDMLKFYGFCFYHKAYLLLPNKFLQSQIH